MENKEGLFKEVVESIFFLFQLTHYLTNDTQLVLLTSNDTFNVF